MAELMLSRRNMADDEVLKDAEAALQRAEADGEAAMAQWARDWARPALTGLRDAYHELENRGWEVRAVELTIDRDAALGAMGKVAGVVLGRTTVPILQHVLLRAEDGVLTIQACDGDMETRAHAPAAVVAQGSTTVAAKKLHDMLRNLPPGSEIALSLSTAPSRLVARCGRSRFQLATLPVSDFPRFDTGQATHTATLGAKALGRLIDRVAFVAALLDQAPDGDRDIAALEVVAAAAGELVELVGRNGASFALYRFADVIATGGQPKAERVDD